MSDTRLRIVQTEDLTPGEVDELIALCAAAFGEPFDEAWRSVGPGLHVIADAGGRPVSHAMIVDRRIYLGHEADTAVDVGYVEHVATRPEDQGEGHASATMRRIAAIIGEAYALGGLATGSNGFYERLGWQTWRGPTGVRMPDGERVRSAHHDGRVMVLRTPRTPAALTLDAPVFVDWRPGEAW